MSSSRKTSKTKLFSALDVPEDASTVTVLANPLARANFEATKAQPDPLSHSSQKVSVVEIWVPEGKELRLADDHSPALISNEANLYEPMHSSLEKYSQIEVKPSKTKTCPKKDSSRKWLSSSSVKTRSVYVCCFLWFFLALVFGVMWSVCSKREEDADRVTAASLSDALQSDCHGDQVCVNWGLWGNYSRCSTTCGRGMRKRSRQCEDETSSCLLAEEETKECTGSPVVGVWSSWGEWMTNCSCGRGEKMRTRSCLSLGSRDGPRVHCVGEDVEVVLCSDCLQLPGRKGVWTAWSLWSETCSEGHQVRRKICNRFNSTTQCQNYQRTEYRSCQSPDCPLDGGWTAWRDWSACSTTCGMGIQSRRRACFNVASENKCGGLPIETRQCRNGRCPPIDGTWATWSGWTTCSSSCGQGMQHRSRNCSSPYPSFGGKSCLGFRLDVRKCSQQACPPIAGGWSSWESWSLCSKTCGVGVVRQRRRLCSSPVPKHGGNSCFGDQSQQQACNILPCL
eukprot:m.9100 g.9100  ORF g.9100 m.9100 type:complete len:509 (+) comp21089_c0_seq2:151-1677(+)